MKIHVIANKYLQDDSIAEDSLGDMFFLKTSNQTVRGKIAYRVNTKFITEYLEDKAKHQPPKTKTFQQKVRHVCKTSVERSFVRQIKKEMLALDDSKGIHLLQHTDIPL